MTLDPAGTVSVLVSDSLQLNAILSPEGYARSILKWSSSKSKVASVSSSGLVIPMKEGTTVITVKAENKKSAALSICVEDPVKATGISFVGTEPIVMYEGESMVLEAVLQP